MRRVNILFYGGAKRVSMARLFKRAAREAGAEAHIFGYELTTTVPLAAEADAIITGLRNSDPAVYAHLDEVCRRHDISVVVPFIDGAVAVAAEFARRYSGRAFVPAGDPAACADMFDKTRAQAIFEQAGLPVPATWHGGEVTHPLIAKPRHGSASKGLIAIDCADDIPANAADYLIQERFDRRRELTVDCYVAVADGTVCAVVPRVRDEVSGGEVSRTTVVHRPEADELVRRTLAATGLRGAVTVQLLEDLDTGRLMIMEINPRLGGGAVAAVHAGANLPAMILAEAAGETPHVCTAWNDIVMTRYPAEVCFAANGDII